MPTSSASFHGSDGITCQTQVLLHCSAGHESRERGLDKPPQLVEWLGEHEDLGIVDIERRYERNVYGGR
jgi:hypothetical protein